MEMNKKFLDMSKWFTFDNFYDPDHESKINIAKKRIETGNKEGEYPIAQPYIKCFENIDNGVIDMDKYKNFVDSFHNNNYDDHINWPAKYSQNNFDSLLRGLPDYQRKKNKEEIESSFKSMDESLSLSSYVERRLQNTLNDFPYHPN